MAGSSGGFLVAWQSSSQDELFNWGIFAQRFSTDGTALGAELQVNTYVTGPQSYPRVAGPASGGFIVTWMSAQQDGSDLGVCARRIDSSGAPVGIEEFQVNTATTGRLAARHLRAAPLALLAIRFTFGFRGEVLVDDAVNLDGCTRCDAAAIEAYLKSLS